jgi:hypothetical protein
VKSSLEEGAFDAQVARGWPRLERKRRLRDTARKSVLAVSCLVLAGSLGWAVRPFFFGARQGAPLSTEAQKSVAPPPAAVPLDALMQQLPKVQGRAVQVQRPVRSSVPAGPADAPEPQVDVVAALLESVRDAYEHGDVARARALLSEIAEKHEDDARAAQALYVLGLIQLDRDRDPKSAAQSFTRALELDPPPELVPTLWQGLQRARGAPN